MINYCPASERLEPTGPDTVGYRWVICVGWPGMEIYGKRVALKTFVFDPANQRKMWRAPW